MKRHYNNFELQQLIKGVVPLKELLKISRHVARCYDCELKLKELAPDFLDNLFNQATESFSAENERHFSNEDVRGFLTAEYSVNRRLEMSEHFRNCLSCKQRLYKTSPEYLEKNIASYLSRREKRESFFWNFNPFVPIFMATILLASLFYLITFSGDATQPDLTGLVNSVSLPDRETLLNHGSDDSKSANRYTDFPKKTEKSTKSADSGKVTLNKPVVSKAENSIAIAESRSSSADKCMESNAKIALSPYLDTITEAQPIFRWKSIKNAVKYNFYLSDTKQVLIEEFESPSATSYIAKNRLVPNKKYKWKIIVTLRDGKTYQSPSIQFSLGGKAKPYSTQAATTNIAGCAKR